MQWKITSRTFLAPHTFEAGSIVEYDGPISMTMEPVDAEAKEKWDVWAKENPLKAAGQRPFDELEIVAPTATLVAEPPPDKEPVTAPQLGAPQKAAPGPSDGGKVLPTPKVGAK